MFKRKELAVPVLLSVAFAIYALLTRYVVNPMPLLMVSVVMLVGAYIRLGQKWKVSRLASYILVCILMAILNYLVFGLGMQAEQALVYFLFAIMLTKCFSLLKFKDYIQVMSLSALSMLAAGAFNQNPSYTVTLIFYLITAGYWVFKFSLISEYVAHLRQKRNSPVSIIHTQKTSWLGPFVRTSLTTLLIALILFSLIPRHAPAFKFAAAMMRQGMSATGFSNELTLGEMTQILEDKTPVLRAKYLPESSQQKNYRGVLYLRGAVYDKYVQHGNVWRWVEIKANQPKRLESSESLAKPTLIQTPIKKDSQDNLWRITIDQPMTPNVFVIDRPLALGANQAMNLTYDYATNIINSGSHNLPKGFTYQLLTEQSISAYNILPLTTQPTTQATTQIASTQNTSKEVEWPGRTRKHRQLSRDQINHLPAKPSHLIPDLTREAGETSDEIITIDLKDFEPVAKKAIADLPENADCETRIRAIESWLKTDFKYSLDNTDVDRSKEPLLDFLVRRKHGHCEYFASALVILAQSLGYDARMVTGFKDGEFNTFGEYYVVRNCDAHAWSEVLIPDVGWMRFDPTPPGREDALKKGDQGPFKWFWDLVDVMQYGWTDNVDDSKQVNRDKFMKGLNKKMMGPEDQVEADPWSLRELWRRMVNLFKNRSSKAVWLQVLHFVLAIGLIGFAIFLIRIFIDVSFIAWETVKGIIHKRWEKRYGLIRYCPVDFYRKLLLWLAVRGVVRQRHETSEEFINRVCEARPDIEKELHFVTRVYQATRFGDKRMNPEQRDYISEMIAKIQQAITTTRVVTREILVEKPAHKPHPTPSESSKSAKAE